MPGSIALFYGDEVGKGNATEYVDQEVWRKRHLTGDNAIAADQRDLGRGIIYTAEYYSHKGQYLYKSIQEILHARALHLVSDSRDSKLLDKPAKEVIAFAHLTQPQITVYANTSQEFVEIPLASETQVILNCNQAIIETNRLLLPPRSGVWIQARN